MHLRQLVLHMALVISFAVSAQAEPSAKVGVNGPQFDTRYFETTRLLNEQKKQADYWQYGWGSFNGAALIYTTALSVGENDAKKRNGNIVNAVQSLVGVGDVIFRPLPAFNADTVCSDLDSPAQCLNRKESLLRDSAERAHEPYELVPHLANAGFNAVSGIVISQIGRTNDALVTGISGFVIGEIQFWSAPRGPISDYDQYQVHFHPVMIQNSSLERPVLGIGASWNL
ncbi:MAG: hypothetical protein ACKVOE_01440 [Rickettsiales bacterium]